MFTRKSWRHMTSKKNGMRKCKILFTARMNECFTQGKDIISSFEWMINSQILETMKYSSSSSTTKTTLGALLLVALVSNERVLLVNGTTDVITGPRAAYACACPDYLGMCQGFVGSVWGDPHLQTFDQVSGCSWDAVIRSIKQEQVCLLLFP